MLVPCATALASGPGAAARTVLVPCTTSLADEQRGRGGRAVRDRARWGAMQRSSAGRAASVARACAGGAPA
ncbi:hypothetical protein, partial [Paraburkholderia mimosarum]